MAIYDFSFDNKYAGHQATITNVLVGSEVAGSPATLDANGDCALALSPGLYRARVDNSDGAFGDGYSVVDGVYNIEASIAAAGGGTAISFDITEHYAETDPPQTPSGWANQLIHWNGDWDTGTSITEDGTGVILAEPGVYAVNVVVKFAEPAQRTLIDLSIDSRHIGGNAVIEPGFTSGSYQVSASGVLRIDDTSHAPRTQLTMDPGAAVDPVIPTINFAYIGFVKLLDA